MTSLSRRCGGGPIFCHKTQTKRVALKGLKQAFLIPITGATGGFSFDGTAADLACLTAPGPTWRGVKLYFQTPKAFSRPHNHTRLFTCCLAGFMAQGLGYLLQSLPLPARKTPRLWTQCAKDHAGQKINKYNFSLFKADFFLCVCVSWIDWPIYFGCCFCFLFFAIFPTKLLLFCLQLELNCVAVVVELIILHTVRCHKLIYYEGEMRCPWKFSRRIYLVVANLVQK